MSNESGSDRKTNLSRRNILLGGTTVAAASAIGTSTPVRVAQAQAQPASSGQRPNIVVIWGDDVGQEAPAEGALSPTELTLLRGRNLHELVVDPF